MNTTTAPNTPVTYDELQSNLETSNRNIVNIKVRIEKKAQIKRQPSKIGEDFHYSLPFSTFKTIHSKFVAVLMKSHSSKTHVRVYSFNRLILLMI